MYTYLAKRGATYYFRRPVPEELRPHPCHNCRWCPAGVGYGGSRLS